MKFFASVGTRRPLETGPTNCTCSDNDDDDDDDDENTPASCQLILTINLMCGGAGIP